MSEHQLDARRLLCPMPVIRTQDKIAELQNGDRLHVLCTDPGVLNDIPTWCRIHGHKVLDSTTSDREITVSIEVVKEH